MIDRILTLLALCSSQEEGSDLEDDDLSGLGSDEELDDAQHVADLKALAEKDPEFFKYLQENDAELLDFDGEGGEAEEESDEEEMSEDSDSEDEGAKQKGKGKEKEVKLKKIPVLTKEMLKGWQKSILEVSSRRTIRLYSYFG
jgi:nucleolar complex protein 2